MAAGRRGKQPAAKAAKRQPTPVQSKEPTPTIRQRKTTPAAAGSRAPLVPRETRAVSVSRSKKAKSPPPLTSQPLADANSGRSSTKKQPRADNNQVYDLSIIQEESDDEQNNQQTSSDERHASPTTSEGPEFENVLDDSPADVEAARLFVPGFVLGFSNNKNRFLCYRNSLLVVLLHSTRIAQWINNRYLPQLDKTGLKRVSYESIQMGAEAERFWPDNTKATKVSQIQYTDVLCEFHHLYWDYWHPRSPEKHQSLVDQAIGLFWDYLKDVCGEYASDRSEYPSTFPSPWEFKGQQDSAGLLRWLIHLARAQREHLINGLDAPMLPKVEQDKLKVLGDLDIENLLSLKRTVRRNCVYCNRATNAKRRSKGLEHETIWTFTVSFPTWKKGQVEPQVDLYDAIQQSLKSETGGLNCGREACLEKAKAIAADVNAKFDAEMRDINLRPGKRGKDADKRACRALRDQRLSESCNYEGYTWNKLAKLPEILFLSINRFLSEHSNKEKGRVEIPEELDLRALVEHRTPLPEETKYRLVGIVNHYGATINSGHYKAQAFKDGRWTEFNDKAVSETNLKTIMDDQVKNKHLFTPYLLMYEKIPVHAAKDGTKDKDKEDSMNNDNQKGDDADVYTNGERQIPLHALARTIENESTTALQIAQPDSELGLNQGHLVVEAAINGTKVAFPTYVIEKHSNFDVRSAQINLTLKDSQTRMQLTASRGLEYVETPTQKRPTPDPDDDDDSNVDRPAKRRKSDDPDSKRSGGGPPSWKTTPSSKRGSPSARNPNPPAGNPANGLGKPKQSQNRSNSVQILRESTSPKPQGATAGDQGLTNTQIQIPGLGDSGKKGSSSDGMDSLFDDTPQVSPTTDEIVQADRQREFRKMFEKSGPLTALRQKSVEPTPRKVSPPRVGRVLRATSLNRNW